MLQDVDQGGGRPVLHTLFLYLLFHLQQWDPGTGRCLQGPFDLSDRNSFEYHKGLVSSHFFTLTLPYCCP